jgi:fructokinase
LVVTQYGGVETGGTKIVCAVGTGPGKLAAVERFPTTDPTETLGQIIAFFATHDPIAALGVASFGPLDLRSGSENYGSVAATPKPGWAGTNVRDVLGAAVGVPVAIDSDVNGAALGEWRWGAARGLDTFLYLTIGTGIGGGAMTNGELVHGVNHPEMGHLLIPRVPDDAFPGICPFHGDCLEGMASGPAIEARWGVPGRELGPLLDQAVALEADYLGSALMNLTLTLMPERIILGGGVMHTPGLLEAVRSATTRKLAGYLEDPRVSAGVDEYVVPPGLGDEAGILGAIALAQRIGSTA